MLKKATSFFLCLVSVMMVFGCDQFKSAFQTTLPSKPATAPTAETPSAPPGTLLAKVNAEVITLESFDEKLKNVAELSPEIKIDTIDAKKSFLNDLITQELIFQEAKSRGIDKQKDVKEAIEAFKKGVMARQLILDETKGITIEPAEIQAFYDNYKKELAAPEEIRAREIVVSSEAAAKEILISLLQGADFAAVAKERSISVSAAQGGEVGVVKKEDKFDKFREVISTLEAGGVSQIFKGPDGFYIVKVEDKKGGSIPMLTDKLSGSDATVYDQIKSLLLQQKQSQRLKDLTDKLRKEAKVDIKEELLR